MIDPATPLSRKIAIDQQLSRRLDARQQMQVRALWQSGVTDEGIESVTGRARATAPIFDRSGEVTIVGRAPGDIQKIQGLFEEAAQASGVELSKYVDAIEYNPKASSPKFDVTPMTGVRYIVVDAKTFNKTRAGQLIVASHELVHTQKFGWLTKYQFGGDALKARDYFFGPTFDPDTPLGHPRYAFDEVVTERLAVDRVERYLGELSPQQIGWSTRYINGWRQRFASPALFP